ncbi:hypothetical protein V8C35DRAFT_279549 [Trichoderma chlorosporum]
MAPGAGIVAFAISVVECLSCQLGRPLRLLGGGGVDAVKANESPKGIGQERVPKPLCSVVWMVTLELEYMETEVCWLLGMNHRHKSFALGFHLSLGHSQPDDSDRSPSARLYCIAFPATPTGGRFFLVVSNPPLPTAMAYRGGI